MVNYTKYKNDSNGNIPESNTYVICDMTCDSENHIKQYKLWKFGAVTMSVCCLKRVDGMIVHNAVHSTKITNVYRFTHTVLTNPITDSHESVQLQL